MKNYALIFVLITLFLSPSCGRGGEKKELPDQSEFHQSDLAPDKKPSNVD